MAKPYYPTNSRPMSQQQQQQIVVPMPVLGRGSRIDATVPNRGADMSRGVDGAINCDITLTPDATQVAGGVNYAIFGMWQGFTLNRFLAGITAAQTSDVLVRNSILKNNNGIADAGSPAVFSSLAERYGLQINALRAKGVGTNAQTVLRSVKMYIVELANNNIEGGGNDLLSPVEIFRFNTSRCDQNAIETQIPLREPIEVSGTKVLRVEWTSVAAGSGDALELQIQRAYLGENLGERLMNAPKDTGFENQGCT